MLLFKQPHWAAASTMYMLPVMILRFNMVPAISLLGVTSGKMLAGAGKLTARMRRLHLIKLVCKSSQVRHVPVSKR